MKPKRVNAFLSEKTDKRLRDFVYKKTGSFRGLSEEVEKAIEEYLDRHENDVQQGFRAPAEA